MTVYELNIEIKEGLFGFLSGNDKKNKQKKSRQNDDRFDMEGNAIFPECKIGNTIIISDKYNGVKIIGSYNEEDILINILGNLFVTNWVKTGERCLKKILSYLLAKYIAEEDIENEDEIDLSPIIKSLEENKDEIEISSNEKKNYTKSELKVLEKIYERILYHRDSLFNDFFMNPKEFKEGWNEVKRKIIVTIENILKTKGDALMHVGMHYSKKEDKRKN